MARIETIRNPNSVVFNVPTQPSIEIRLDRLAANIKDRAMVHGIIQRVGDAAAKRRDPVTGRSASWADKHAAMRNVADALIAGDWTVKAERLAPDAITPERVEAVANVRKADVATVQQWLESITAEQRAKAFGHPSIAAELARIRAERALAGADPDDAEELFEGLGDDEDHEEE